MADIEMHSLKSDEKVVLRGKSSVANLGITVDTSDVREATKAFDELAAAAARAEVALRRLGVKIGGAEIVKFDAS